MRRLAILPEIPSLTGGIYLNAETFCNAKQFLGQEYPFAVYDMRTEEGVCLNLEALAIAAGTIQDGGVLYLICPEWESLPQQIDTDSRRWNAGKAVACPNFYAYFKTLVKKFGFDQPYEPATPSGQKPTRFCNFTAEQQAIFDHLPQDPAAVHLITAPRGRGKSTLAGKLAQQIATYANVIITARSRAVLPQFRQSVSPEDVPFFAPDKLLQLIEKKAVSAHTWLFVDEGASLPLPMLQALCDYFDKVIITTTTQNYEGTGRGFSLKLRNQLNRSAKIWTLNTPLRWDADDPLERFIDELLLLTPPSTVQDRTVAFYHLLAEAHYKTTPTDLRRLFDADEQYLQQLIEEDELIGGIWAVKEGGLDEALTQAVWRGERRPAGSLVAQYLCFQGNLPEACRLRSIRISRIAIALQSQRQGKGRRLIAAFIAQWDHLQNLAQNQPLVDYLSVSFGLSEALLHFWQQCGFRLVQISPNKEASSGYHSAMMLYPLSEQGKAFVQQAQTAFERNLALQPFYADLQKNLPIRPLVHTSLNEDDWQNLRGFAFASRSPAACCVSLIRLYSAYPDLALLAPFVQGHVPVSDKKAWVDKLRPLIADFLTNKEMAKG